MCVNEWKIHTHTQKFGCCADIALRTAAVVLESEREEEGERTTSEMGVVKSESEVLPFFFFFGSCSINN